MHWIFARPVIGFFVKRVGLKERSSLELGVFVGLCFAVGVLAEDVAYKFHDPHDTPWSAVSDTLIKRWTSSRNPTLRYALREDVLFDQIAARDPKIKALGSDLIASGVFQRLFAVHSVKNQAPLAAISGEQFARWAQGEPALPPGASPCCWKPRRSSDICPESQCLDHASRMISTVFYQAKTYVYAHPQHSAELSRLQARLEFSRSLSAIAASYALVTILAGLVAMGIRAVQRRLPSQPKTPLLTGDFFERQSTPATSWRPYPWRAVLIIILFVVAYLASLLAYVHEAEEFNKRIFGYYASHHIEERLTRPARTEEAAAPVQHEPGSASPVVRATATTP